MKNIIKISILIAVTVICAKVSYGTNNKLITDEIERNTSTQKLVYVIKDCVASFAYDLDSTYDLDNVYNCSVDVAIIVDSDRVICCAGFVIPETNVLYALTYAPHIQSTDRVYDDVSLIQEWPFMATFAATTKNNNVEGVKNILVQFFIPNTDIEEIVLHGSNIKNIFDFLNGN